MANTKVLCQALQLSTRDIDGRLTPQHIVRYYDTWHNKRHSLRRPILMQQSLCFGSPRRGCAWLSALACSLLISKCRTLFSHARSKILQGLHSLSLWYLRLSDSHGLNVPLHPRNPELNSRKLNLVSVVPCHICLTSSVAVKHPPACGPPALLSQVVAADARSGPRIWDYEEVSSALYSNHVRHQDLDVVKVGTHRR